MTTPQRKPVFIEKIFPVNLLNQQVYFENGGNPFKGLHRWYSRKPLSFSRASVLGSLLPGDVTMEEFEYLLGLDKARKNESDLERDDRHNRTRLYKTPPSPERVKRVQELCEELWGDKTPAVLDAFAGGGSIPFEAARYGLRVFASDLNPVAVVTMKAAIAFPLEFGAELQQDIDRWVQWVGEQAEERLNEFFPSSHAPQPSPPAPMNGGERLSSTSVESPQNGDLGAGEQDSGKSPEWGFRGNTPVVSPQPSPPTPKFGGEESGKSPRMGDLGAAPQPPTLGEKERIQNYLWAHTVQCPHCESTVPLSPNWWIDRSLGAIKKGAICAVKPVPNLAEKRVDFELIKGKKGKGNTIQTPDGDFDPNDFSTMSRGVGKCPNCESVIEDSVIKKQAQDIGLGHQLYAVAFKKNQGTLEFRIANNIDLQGFELAEKRLRELENSDSSYLIPDIHIPYSNRVYERDCVDQLGLTNWKVFFNSRQLLTLVTYVEIINEAKEKMRAELGEEKTRAIATYLACLLDRCIDHNCRLSCWKINPAFPARASASHSLNLMWNYCESTPRWLWDTCSFSTVDGYIKLCELLGTKINSSSFQSLETHTEKSFHIENASADSLYHLPDQSIDAVVTDPPYYSTIQYAELSDFFYVWQKRILSDIFPELYYSELTDKDREAVANPSRFRAMGISPKDLADQDYEAKMQMAFSEYYRVLKDNGVMTVQFNHKDSGAWDVLAQSLINAGFEITASWAVSTENPQNLHQAQKNSVSSTVLLVCRKRLPPNPQSGGSMPPDPQSGGIGSGAENAWWDDIRPELNNLVTQRAEEFEANGITGIDLYLSAFGPALSVFSRRWPVLDSSGIAMRPEAAFEEARKAISHYRLNKLLNQETSGFDALTQWYILAWDSFRAREFSFDEARQLAIAVGGFDINDLKNSHKLISAKSGTCSLLTPTQRLKKRAFSVSPTDFSLTSLVDGLHAVIAIYQEEQSIEPVRQFLKKTELLSNDQFMRAWEVALKAIPHIGDEKKRLPEEKALADLWLAMDEIKAKVRYVTPEDAEGSGQAVQGSLF